jgi:hypothetical protein
VIAGRSVTVTQSSSQPPPAPSNVRIVGTPR